MRALYPSENDVRIAKQLEDVPAENHDRYLFMIAVKEFAKGGLKELEMKQPEKWADESFTLAKQVAYRGGTLQGGSDRDGAQVLPEGYTTEAKCIAKDGQYWRGIGWTEV